MSSKLRLFCAPASIHDAYICIYMWIKDYS